MKQIKEKLNTTLLVTARSNIVSTSESCVSLLWIHKMRRGPAENRGHMI